MALTEHLRVARFNRICRALALLWLAVVLPVSFIVRPTNQDLGGIYIGGVVARSGQWSALYPKPVGPARYYVGDAFRQTPAMDKLAAAHHVKGLSAFLNPPWQAIVDWPLALLSFAQAHWALLGLNILCMWGVALAAGRAYELCAGRMSRIAGVMTLVTVCSPLAYRSIRVMNVSPIVAFCIAVTIWDLLGRLDKSGFPGGVAAALGGLLKLVTGALLPVALVVRRWRIIIWAFALTAAVVGLSWAMAGSAVFGEFFRVIAPSLGRSSAYPGNKSLQAFLLRVSGQAPLGPAISTLLHSAQWACLGLIFWLLFQPRRQGRGAYWADPRHVFAAGLALISWLLIFSPLCWEHYFVYLCPFWGWLAWEARQSRWRAVAAGLAIALHWFTLPSGVGALAHEPINSYGMFAAMIMFVLAISRLVAGTSAAERLPRRASTARDLPAASDGVYS